MNGETVVRNEITGWGQHWVEVMRMGQPVDKERWTAEAPLESLHLVRRWMRHEQALDVYRLFVWWPAREWMRLDEAMAKQVGRNEVVLWYIEDQTIREAAARAAGVWWRRRGGSRVGGSGVGNAGASWCPERVLVWKIPAGAPECFALEDFPETPVLLQEAAWVPKGYLVVA